MIKSFLHKGLETFFRSSSQAGIQPHHADRLRLQLTLLDKVRQPGDMNSPGWRLHQLSNGHWSIWVNDNWRMTFFFEGEDVIFVDYQDDH